jgi:Fe-S-cluster-containing hydrogenase component 2
MQNCPADAIGVEHHTLVIDQNVCIRCGICHDICPQNAVRHDSEQNPEKVQADLNWVQTLREHPYYLNDPGKQAELSLRLKKHFNRIIQIAQQTLAHLQ